MMEKFFDFMDDQHHFVQDSVMTAIIVCFLLILAGVVWSVSTFLSPWLLAATPFLFVIGVFIYAQSKGKQ